MHTSAFSAQRFARASGGSWLAPALPPKCRFLRVRWSASPTKVVSSRFDSRDSGPRHSRGELARLL